MLLHALSQTKRACVSAEAQTDTTFVRKGRPVVNFLDSTECPSDDDVPNCFHLGDNSVYIRSPRIPVTVEGVRVSMVLYTGAEVTILSSDFMHRLFPGQDLPDQGRNVRYLGGIHLAIKGPVMLTIELCNIVLRHPVYYCDSPQMSLSNHCATYRRFIHHHFVHRRMVIHHFVIRLHFNYN